MLPFWLSAYRYIYVYIIYYSTIIKLPFGASKFIESDIEKPNFKFTLKSKDKRGISG